MMRYRNAKRATARRRICAGAKNTPFASLGLRNSISHVNFDELEQRVEEKRVMSFKLNVSVVESRGGRATSPLEVDASLHAAVDGASAGAATSPRIGKQVRLTHFAQAGRERA